MSAEDIKVLHLVANGLTCEEVGHRMGYSRGWVAAKLGDVIYPYFNVNNAASAAYEAMKQGVLP